MGVNIYHLQTLVCVACETNRLVVSVDLLIHLIEFHACMHARTHARMHILGEYFLRHPTMVTCPGGTGGGGGGGGVCVCVCMCVVGIGGGGGGVGYMSGLSCV